MEYHTHLEKGPKMSRKDNPETIKTEIKKTYGAAVKTFSDKDSCCGAPAIKGKFTELAGYEADLLKSLPQGLSLPSFGCGDPVNLMEIKSGETVLDLGSGAGLDLFLAARKVGPSGHVIGVDMTPEMIAKAKDNIAKAGATNIEVRLGEMENLPVESGSIDWVMSNCVINLSPDKGKVFSEIVRVLKPGGRMLVSDIVSVGQLPEAIRTDMALWAGCIGGTIPEDEYLKTAVRAGLSDVTVVNRITYGLAELMLMLGCCGGEVRTTKPDPDKIALLAGRIASVKVVGRKPGR